MAGIRIKGLGKATGENKVTNDDLAQIVETSDEWVREKTGIISRYFAKEKTNEDMAYEAGEIAIRNAGVDKENIAICIICTFTPDDYAPAVACNVAGRLGLKEEILAFDLNGACAGFIFGCNIANGLLATGYEEGKKKYALIIGSEKISPLMDMEDRATCVLFGDGAGAAVLEYDPQGEFAFIGGCSADKDILYCSRKDAAIKMQGQEVYRFAVSKVPEAIKKVMEKAGKTEEDIDSFVCHQANERIIDNAARRISKRGEKFYKNLYYYGNTSAASIPIALRDMELEGKLSEGSRLVCTGFGAGLTYGAMYITKAGEAEKKV